MNMSYCLVRHLKTLFKQGTCKRGSNAMLMRFRSWPPETKVGSGMSAYTTCVKNNVSGNTSYSQPPHHIPVMTEEVIELLDPRKGQVCYSTMAVDENQTRSRLPADECSNLHAFCVLLPLIYVSCECYW